MSWCIVSVCVCVCRFHTGRRPGAAEDRSVSSGGDQSHQGDSVNVRLVPLQGERHTGLHHLVGLKNTHTHSIRHIFIFYIKMYSVDSVFPAGFDRSRVAKGRKGAETDFKLLSL